MKISEIQDKTGEWLYWDRSFRIPVSVNPGEFERYEKPVEMDINFTWLLASANAMGVLKEDSICVAEFDGENNMSRPVPHQFDRASDYDSVKNVAGTIIFMLQGTTSLNMVRNFHIYFDISGMEFSTQAFAPGIILTDGVWYEGQESYKIETANCIYYYHKKGAGFASMIDRDGNDWIGYHPENRSAGPWRGIPNVAYPDSFTHPGQGSDSSTSTILSNGPLKLKILSEDKESKISCMWEIYPYYARFTLLEIGHPYWFLYEGTPGGKLDQENSFCVWSSGKRMPLSKSWCEVLPAPEWIYFTGGKVERMLYFVHEESDDVIDTYWPCEGNMTVFGFGRKGMDKYATQLPAHFIMGFGEDTEYEKAKRIIDSAFREYRTTCGILEVQADFAKTSPKKA